MHRNKVYLLKFLTYLLYACLDVSSSYKNLHVIREGEDVTVTCRLEGRENINYTESWFIQSPVQTTPIKPNTLNNIESKGVTAKKNNSIYNSTHMNFSLTLSGLTTEWSFTVLLCGAQNGSACEHNYVKGAIMIKVLPMLDSSTQTPCSPSPSILPTSSPSTLPTFPESEPLKSNALRISLLPMFLAGLVTGGTIVCTYF